MVARPGLTIYISPYALPMPLIGCVIAMLPIWIDLPQETAALVGFLIAFRLRTHLTRRPTRA
ncbi:hypothetical protein [Streptomyces sp. enrichment culture]|uniref:hypothetical protein n=1 Tax=Streptomyces sp. enrichment culture TaxID=1795815 RepID=UPI003F571D71